LLDPVKSDGRSSRLRELDTGATASEVQVAGNGADHGDYEHGPNDEGEEEVVLSCLELFHDDPRWVGNTQTKSPDVQRDPGFFASQVQLTAWTSTRIIYRRGDAGQRHPETGRHDSSRRAQQAPARAGRRELGSQREHVTVAQVEHLWTS
jgi:hypothetical protein